MLYNIWAALSREQQLSTAVPQADGDCVHYHYVMRKRTDPNNDCDSSHEDYQMEVDAACAGYRIPARLPSTAQITDGVSRRPIDLLMVELMHGVCVRDDDVRHASRDVVGCSRTHAIHSDVKVVCINPCHHPWFAWIREHCGFFEARQRYRGFGGHHHEQQKIGGGCDSLGVDAHDHLGDGYDCQLLRADDQLIRGIHLVNEAPRDPRVDLGPSKDISRAKRKTHAQRNRHAVRTRVFAKMYTYI